MWTPQRLNGSSHSAGCCHEHRAVDIGRASGYGPVLLLAPVQPAPVIVADATPAIEPAPTCAADDQRWRALRS